MLVTGIAGRNQHQVRRPDRLDHSRRRLGFLKPPRIAPTRPDPDTSAGRNIPRNSTRRSAVSSLVSPLRESLIGRMRACTPSLDAISAVASRSVLPSADQFRADKYASPGRGRPRETTTASPSCRHGLQAKKRVALHAPAALRAELAREHVGDRIDVGRDVQPPPPHVVARINNDRQLFRAERSAAVHPQTSRRPCRRVNTVIMPLLRSSSDDRLSDRADLRAARVSKPPLSFRQRRELSINRQPLPQLEIPWPPCARAVRSRVRPRLFGIDEIGRQRRNAAPVVNAAVEQIGIMRIG